jgi:adenylylsulfate reductase subunit A
MDTPTAMAKLAESMTPRVIKHLEAEAWEDFLDMTIAQCGVWAGENIEPDKEMSELMPTEPYLLGSHAGCAGIWCSGPDDLPGTPDSYHWGYNRMTTVSGLFTSGDGVGASGHKFSSGSHAEGRIAAKAMVQFVLDNKDWKPELSRSVEEVVEEIYRPVATFLEHKDYTTAIDINPHYITPKMFQFRLQKIMDEYVAGVGTWYQTNGKMLEIAEKKLEMLREDSLKMRAKDLHELLRAWENYHRLIAAYAHMKHIQFRQETRYPGYYYRMDYLHIDDENWKCFVNSKFDRITGEWTVWKEPYVQMIKYQDDEPIGIANQGCPV